MSKSVCLILTCTINVKNIAHMKRSDTYLRLKDYKLTFLKWLKNKNVKEIIFVENSNYDLSEFRKMALEFKAEKKIEFISYDGQKFPRKLGKGFGESQAIERVISDSLFFLKNEKFIKINGRYYVPNISNFLEFFSKTDSHIMADLSLNLTWSDSRLFGGSKKFFSEYLVSETRKTNDSIGLYFEYLLAASIHRAIADGLKWVIPPCPAVIDGVSGTSGRRYEQNFFKISLKRIFLEAKRFVIKH